MVKPTLKPEPDKKEDGSLKDDVKLKEWGIIPATVMLDESEKEKDKKDAEAALEGDNLETEFDDSPRPFVVKCCACFAVFTIVLIITCTVGSFLYFHYGRDNGHKWKGWCSVGYDGDDNDSGDKRGDQGGRHGGRGGGSSSEEKPNWHLNNPRHTGPPGGNKQCGQQSEVNLDEQFSRVERPEESDCERITILHDYNTNISTYRLWKSEICYISWIEQEVLMDPEEFWQNMQDPSYLNQHFNELSLMYRAVLPAIPTPLHEQEDGKYGEYLDGPKLFLCQGVESYWIEKIPEEEIEAFLQMIEQVIQELLQLAASADQYDMNEDRMPGEYDGAWPFGEPEDGRDWGMGGREEEGWPMDGDTDTPYERYPGGHPGGHPGRHPGGHPGAEPHGERMRRNAGKKHRPARPYFGNERGHGMKDRIKGMFNQAKKADECLNMNAQKIKEIGKDKQIFNPKVYAPCIIKKAQESGLLPIKEV